MKLPYNPIEHITWLKSEDLVANDYNPNVVQADEMRLLELSLRKNGWIQPILITHDNQVIDGYHRTTLARMRGWLVPCCILNITEAERMLLTIRINRAKGTHIAFKMAEIVKRLVNQYGLSKEYIAGEIGASSQEIDLLLTEDVFKKLGVSNHVYSKAWEPKK